MRKKIGRRVYEVGIVLKNESLGDKLTLDPIELGGRINYALSLSKDRQRCANEDCIGGRR